MQEDITSALVEIIFSISRSMKGEMSYTSQLTHLSILQIQTLIFLDKNKNVPMSEIAKNFHIELSSATSLLNKLYSQKLVTRQNDEKDRRLIRITLTSEGKQILDKVITERKIKLKRLLSYLSEQERLDLLNLLTSINSRLQQKNEN